ncbi:5'-nucleotidase [Nocardioides zeae]|uniref:5'-nucleotidase n=1 Tax=Nocardioides zeae TaxID=1457234 RepID=A0ACC6IFP1_9ACTN|nr:ExeM/NucH family extracellular endonuclease [Nocardioides zeae]MDR6176455.1 5'-nucleotidase [Nocardioides zeae]MDR6209468.1 5'-nucleotidase [Nocardioides zeae]
MLEPSPRPSPSRQPGGARPRRALAAGLGLGLAVSALAALPGSATAAVDGSGVVISEFYGGGGNSGAEYTHDFVELYNPTSAAISLEGWSVQYRNAAGTSAVQVTSLTGSIPAGGHYLVQWAQGNGGTKPLPTPDAIGTVPAAAGGGQVWLASTTTAVTPPVGNVAVSPIVDFLGGAPTAPSYEGAAVANAPSNTTSLQRAANGKDTDSNAADFAVAAPTPQNSGSTTPEPEPEPVEPTDVTIAEIQGTGAETPLDRTALVRTRGVVTASYPTGGFNGFYLQTAGTGGDPKPAEGGASDAVFVWLGSPSATYPEVGDHVEVVGLPTEFNGLTQLDARAASDGSTTVLTEPAEMVKPRAFVLPAPALREQYEGELVLPSEDYTVSNNFNLNNFGEIGLAVGDTPLITPTELVTPDSPELDDVKADNAARAIAIDDGSSTNYLGNATNKAIPLPWISGGDVVRVNASATITEPVVIDWRNSTWKYQPTQQLTAEGVAPATFEDTRTAAPEAVGGDLELATFNVLNYFSTTGEEWAAAASGRSCSYFTDRAGANITNDRCEPNGPRGAANQVNLERQEAKIVAAINAIDADVISLEEIENSAVFGLDRDAALASLVTALNEQAGAGHWAYVPSPTAVPAAEDVIRTAFIYQPATVETVGESVIHDDEAVFFNAREPLAQAFKPAGSADDDAFSVIVNHFKSKSTSGAPSSGDNANGEQGAWNGDRVRQAESLADFTAEFAAEAGTEAVFLTGDFNSYTQEDPLHVLYDEGFTDIASEGEWSYSFSGMSGSLDHVLANEAAAAMVTGSDIWEINAVESVAYEYSRSNYNATDFYAPDAYRSSDHEPHVVGIAVGEAEPAPATVVTPGTVTNAYGDVVRVPVEIESEGAAGGRVDLHWNGGIIGSADVVDGQAVVEVPRRTLLPKSYRVLVRYSGDATTQAADGGVTIAVGRARTNLLLSATQPLPAGRSGTLTIRIGNSSGFPATGWVNVVYGGKAFRVFAVRGLATITLQPGRTGTHRASVYYEGSGTVSPAFGVLSIRVG